MLDTSYTEIRQPELVDKTLSTVVQKKKKNWEEKAFTGWSRGDASAVGCAAADWEDRGRDLFQQV